MIPLNDILEDMAGHMRGVMVLSIVGLDGLTVAEFNPAGIDTDPISALFASFMQSVGKSVNELEQLGAFEENLVLIQNEKSWVLTRLLADDYFLSIVTTRDESIRNIRLMARKYSDKLEKILKSG